MSTDEGDEVGERTGGRGLTQWSCTLPLRSYVEPDQAFISRACRFIIMCSLLTETE
jgi:hypothetical protein